MSEVETLDVSARAGELRRAAVRRRLALLAIAPAALGVAALSYGVIGRRLRPEIAQVIEGAAAVVTVVLVWWLGRGSRRGGPRGQVPRRNAKSVALLFPLGCFGSMLLTMALIVGPVIGLVVVGYFLVVVWPLATVLGPRLSFVALRRTVDSTASQVLERDRRPPVVLLRSFAVDLLPVRRGWFSVGSSGAGSFESVIVDRLWRRGPVIATASPARGRWGEATGSDADPSIVRWKTTRGVTVWRSGYRRVPGGAAALARLPSAHWQHSVASWLSSASLVVIVAGQTRGLRWELDHLRDHELCHKLVLMVPPTTTDADAERVQEDWRLSALVLGADPRVTVPVEIDGARIRAVVPGIPGRRATVIESSATRHADAFDVAAAVEAAAGIVIT